MTTFWDCQLLYYHFTVISQFTTNLYQYTIYQSITLDLKIHAGSGPLPSPPPVLHGGGVTDCVNSKVSQKIPAYFS